MDKEYINLIEKNPAFGDWFDNFRFSRVVKLEKHFGKEWFKDKNILELGCAFGNIGFHFESLGANVTFSDANKKCLEIVKSKNINAKTILINQDTKWNLNQSFDLIIHFGILYNLNYWERDLITSIKHSKHIALETSVTKFKDNSEFKIINYVYEHDLHGPFNNIGTLVSAQNIENVIEDNNCSFIRYDTSDLNMEGFFYDWNEEELPYTGNEKIINSHWDNPFFGGRRFWIINKNE